MDIQSLDLRWGYQRIEDALTAALEVARPPHGPPRLSDALHHAVFPGGARVRPRLCLAVARACGETMAPLADAAAAAVELLHCASLVHDDLPCFDDAALRRGVPTVHKRFGESLAVLTGDALIVMAFDVVARAALSAPERGIRLIAALARGAGVPGGIAAGQAWEAEPGVSRETYQRTKTGALFEAAAEAGALASGGDPRAWRPVGERLGRAYQVADDLADVLGDPSHLGKPTGRDIALGRPNTVLELGVEGAGALFDRLVTDVAEAVPDCAHRPHLQSWLVTSCRRLLPVTHDHGHAVQ